MTDKTTADPTPELTERLRQSHDLVDRIFAYIFSDPVLAEAIKGVGAGPVERVMDDVRAEFASNKTYVRRTSPTVADRARRQRTRDVLSLFNGRNATEVARRLGIGRTTVYRIIKQSYNERRVQLSE